MAERAYPPVAALRVPAALLALVSFGAAEPAQCPPARAADAPERRIALAAGTFAAGSPPQLPPDWLDPGRGDSVYALVHFSCAAAMRAGRRALERDIPGALGLDVASPGTVVFRLPRASLSAAAEVAGVDWIGIYHPGYKLSAALGALDERAEPGPPRERELAVTLFQPESLRAAEERLRALGLQVIGRVEAPHRKTLMARGSDLDPAALLALAREPAVRFIETAPRYRTLNSNTSPVLQGGSVSEGTPYWSAGVRGAGQSLAVMDSGLDVDTPWFAHTLADAGVPGPQHRKVFSYAAWGGGTIGTCACVNISPLPGQRFSFSHGTLTAANTLANRRDLGLSDVVDGMAPDARIHFQDIGNSSGTQGTCDTGALYPPVDLRLPFQDAYDRGSRVHSNSWGSALGDAYTVAAADVDQFLWMHPDFSVLFAAGDCGPASTSGCARTGSATIGAPATAKNDVTVGAAEQDPKQEEVAGFSSRGPETVGSGRIGPTLTMIGADTARAHSFASVNGAQDLGSDCRFASGDCDIGGAVAASCIVFGMQGTSYATSFAAGALLLIRDYLARGFFPSGTPRPEDTFIDPSGPLLKALLLQGSVFMSGAGAGADRLNNDQGYGRVQLTQALPLAGDPRTPPGLALWDRALSRGLDETLPARQHRFEVRDTSREVRVTLAYYDPPSSAGTAGSLINDLSLSVTDPNGNRYLGNSFSGAFSIRNGGQEDLRNPTEMVVIAPADLLAGIYTATIAVGSGGVSQPHPVLGGQPYALAASGGIVQLADPAGGLGSVPGDAQAPGTPLTVALDGDGVRLEWGPSCLDQDYIVYRGELAELPLSWTSQAGVLAPSTGGLNGARDDTPGPASYYFVAPTDGAFEGSYGRGSSGAERPQSAHSPYARTLERCDP